MLEQLEQELQDAKDAVREAQDALNEAWREFDEKALLDFVEENKGRGATLALEIDRAESKLEAALEKEVEIESRLKVYNAIHRLPCHVRCIIERSGLSESRVNSILTVLEGEGLVSRLSPAEPVYEKKVITEGGTMSKELTATQLRQNFQSVCIVKDLPYVVHVQTGELGGQDFEKEQLCLDIRVDEYKTEQVVECAIRQYKNGRSRFIYGPTNDTQALFDTLYFWLRV